MPFWRSLLGGSSSGSASSSSSSSRKSSSNTTNTSTTSSNGNDSPSLSGKSRASAKPSKNKASASATQPIGIPSVTQQQPPFTSSSSASVSASATASSSASAASRTSTNNDDNDNDNDDDDDTDTASIPQTPYSTGHSPSHARHKFPAAHASANNSTNNDDDLEALGDSSISIANSNSNTSPATTASNNDLSASAGRPPRQTGSVSSVTSNLSRTSILSNNTNTTTTSDNNYNTSNSTVNNGNPTGLSRPDIPTTHTILANPLPQPSSGLAAAISSVLPSSANPLLSSSPNQIGNGKNSSPNDNGGPRTFDIDDMIARLLDVGYSGKISKSVCLKNSEITAICSAAREVFLSQPTLIELSPPVKIVGDVHGQYSDLIRLFEMCGFPPKSNYLFLGDYVDRGKQSLETILLLLCYKVKYPENFFLLRGNHECANVTRVYGFYDECKRRCSIKIWKTFVDVFNCLPITSLVASKIFCVHGGLSPSLSSMDDIRRISRPTDVPDYGLLNDLLWSDPSDTAIDWEDNERGVSYCFGKSVIQEFLAKYDFDLICRAHMVVEDGYEFWNERTLVTIFSAPNYCGEFDNFAAVMSVSEDLLCAFELLKPLDGPALKKELLKSRRKNSAAIAAGSSALSP